MILIGIQDMIFLFYYVCIFDFKNVKKGDVFEFKCFMDDKVWLLKVKYVGDEVIYI